MTDKRLVVLNSFGPMASSLLAGLVEKFGYSNYPLRKMRLHQYLMGEYALNSKVMEKRLLVHLQNHSKPALSGGVSVLDRGDQPPKTLVDKTRVEKQVAKLEKTDFSSIQDLYFTCRDIYGDAVVYKDNAPKAGWHQIMPVDFARYDATQLCAAYENAFDNVKFIHLTRPFRNWMNSLASQNFLNPKLESRIKFFPHLRFKDFCDYEASVAKASGITLGFDDMFNIPIEELSAKVADYLGTDMPAIDWREEQYDMYGKFVDYQKGFTPFDDKQIYLQPKTLDMMDSWAKTGKINKKSYAFISWLAYLKDMTIFRANSCQ